ncbi:hypothetical protein [Solicola gregarius]|uniref:Uncharacterized protein n=1 Tax=Solicola gregarius TaxID=2908642 RepID=A0AA46YLR0_9ACTN|nr:hypothetical protein [Solicola gregarius]UYM05113.1 hypothetical protein L0C25_21745 [Solicola gregarius]
MSETRSRSRLWAVLIAAAVVLGAAFGGLALLRAGSNHDGATWDSYSVTRDRIIIYKTVRPCDKIVNAELEETDERIEITLHVDFGGVCADLAAEKSTDVSLNEPVGDRAVYDGACLHQPRDERQCIRPTRQ